MKLKNSYKQSNDVILFQVLQNLSTQTLFFFFFLSSLENKSNLLMNLISISRIYRFIILFKLEFFVFYLCFYLLWIKFSVFVDTF